MKKNRFKRLHHFNNWQSKTFRKFLFSYLGILFIALNLLIILTIWRIASNMREEEIRVTQSKLYTIAEDLEIQMEAMRGMAMEIAARQEFRLDYFRLNKYREIELLNRLKNYRKTSDICEEYFVKYSRLDTIFTSAGTTMPLKIRLDQVSGGGEQGEIMELIELSCEESKERIMIFAQEGTVLFLYPLKTYASAEIGMEGVLCFQSDEKQLRERIQKIAGIMNGEFAIYYQDICILGNEVDGVGNSGHVLEQMSLEGNVRICFAIDEEGCFSWENVFTAREVAIYFSISVLLLGLGVFMSYWNFKPMRKITEKYQSTAEESLMADWDSIDRLIESLLRGKERSNKLLQEQYQMMREQIIQLITQGSYSERVQEHMTLLNIRLEGTVYGILLCAFTDLRALKAHQKGMYRAVEELSDEGIALYPCWDNHGNLRVLVTAEEKYQLEEATELLQSLFEAKGLAAEIGVTGIAHSLGQMGQDFVRDIRQLDAERGAGRQSAVPRPSSTAQQAVDYIKANCTNYDLSLDLLAKEFQITPTYLCRIIKQETGMSYKEYLTGLRIAEAKRLLEDKSISVVDVCQQTGYGNVSYFIKVFQKITGVTPAKYRDEC